MKIVLILSVLAAAAQAKITSSALRKLEQEQTFTAFVTFKPTATTGLESLESTPIGERREVVYSALSAAAVEHKETLSSIVGDRKVKAFWITKAATVENVDRALADKIAKIDNVLKVDVIKTIKESPVLTKKDDGAENSPADNSRPTGIQWGVTTIGATDVWKTTKGEGVIIGSIDSGVRHTHESIKSKWRAAKGWYDPYYQTAEPNDLSGHGTHTIGTMVGDFGIGVAPGAQFISCLGLYKGSGTNAALIECAEFMMCPTDTDGSHPDCKKGANVVNNSWGSDSSTDPWYQDVVDAWHKAGITPIFANGNEGPACATAGNPASYPNVISVGAIGSRTDDPTQLAYFSSKGPAKYVDRLNQARVHNLGTASEHPVLVFTESWGSEEMVNKVFRCCPCGGSSSTCDGAATPNAKQGKPTTPVAKSGKKGH
ncbi:hypothetical protein SDRG_13039 [Saprolegnia diclina VS20]|uniref:subtilisin n=1 Tax=Saprolegnia diclina (strain VS20) TaxID=1156394 RepID=T0Q3K1_SAPDV|nr:hypothetical protein SDRG_13039 [Saprolegnia diclina VS20]EQC29166.1 hypothetical protein SDRG_13039 [Saprolegnia diclina VS20]|eukprot:XP_008617344.1 hypothetical protein SDRG_13039 [Saprolegnia diclina VS20]